jgi:hypothetical protein
VARAESSERRPAEISVHFEARPVAGRASVFLPFPIVLLRAAQNVPWRGFARVQPGTPGRSEYDALVIRVAMRESHHGMPHLPWQGSGPNAQVLSRAGRGMPPLRNVSDHASDGGGASKAAGRQAARGAAESETPCVEWVADHRHILSLSDPCGGAVRVIAQMEPSMRKHALSVAASIDRHKRPARSVLPARAAPLAGEVAIRSPCGTG